MMIVEELVDQAGEQAVCFYCGSDGPFIFLSSMEYDIFKCTECGARLVPPAPEQTRH